MKNLMLTTIVLMVLPIMTLCQTMNMGDTTKTPKGMKKNMPTKHDEMRGMQMQDTTKKPRKMSMPMKSHKMNGMKMSDTSMAGSGLWWASRCSARCCIRHDKECMRPTMPIALSLRWSIRGGVCCCLATSNAKASPIF